MRVEMSPAYILHQRAYRDTSLIIDLFSREYGVISAVAKGAKRPKSPFRQAMQNFSPLLASWAGSRDLVTLTRLEVAQFKPRLLGNRLVAGFYLNEILLRLLPKTEPHELLFDAYTTALARLAQNDIEPALRQFELELLKQLGYDLLLEHDADSGEQIIADASYLYVFEHGPVRVESSSGENGLVMRGESLLALVNDSLATENQRMQARLLTRQALKPLLGNKPLLSRELWRVRTTTD